MNILEAEIIAIEDKPVYRKTSDIEYFYRKCKINCHSNIQEHTLIAHSLNEILAYKIGDIVYV